MVAPLEAKEVVFAYPNGVRALRHVSLKLGAGELCAVIGPNGAGKSTLLRVLAGLVRADGGSVRVFGEALAALSFRARARRIAVMQQGIRVPPGLGVREVVATARYAYRGPFDRPGAVDDAVVDRALAAVDASALATRRAGELSGGERQRILLARVLAQETPCVLLDEPTASLDPAHQLAFLGTLRALVTAGRSVLLVTHDINLASQFASRIVLLAAGRVLADGSPARILVPGVLAPVYGDALEFGELRSAPAGEARPWVLPWVVDR